MASKVFKEKQRYSDTVTLALLGAGALASLIGAVVAYTSPELAPGHFLVYLLTALGLGLVIRFFLRLRLKLTVTDQNIKYKMTPLHDKAQKISWDEVDSCKVVKTHPLAPHHGSRKIFGGERRFTLSGRNGLSVTTKDGRHYFIGCKNVDELSESLNQLSVG